MAQSLFDHPRAGANGLDTLSESQEELRGELALLAERLDGLDRTLRKLVAGESAAREAMQQQHGQLLESLSTDQRRRERLIFALIAAAVLVAGVALVLAFL